MCLYTEIYVDMRAEICRGMRVGTHIVLDKWRRKQGADRCG